MDRYILNIDVGTGSGRAIIFDFQGRQVAVSQREWLPKEDPRYPGSQDFDTNEAWRLLALSIKEVIKTSGISPENICAITATSMREGFAVYNKNGKVIWACTNADSRAKNEAIEMVKNGLADPMYETGGDWVSMISPPRLLWIKRHEPEIYRNIAKMSMLSDWVLYCLSGEIMTDPSIGSSSGLFDLRDRKWSSEIIAKLELPVDIFPRVCESGTMIGRVTSSAAEETGLKPGTPVVTGGADTQMALVGAGAVQSGVYTVCGGTFWQTTVTWDSPLIDKMRKPRTLCHAVPGLWMTEGIGFYHGFTMRWFRDGFCQEQIQTAKVLNVDAYSEMEKLASEIPPGSNGVHGVFSNIMEAKRWRHAPPSFVGFDLLRPAATGKAACIRAIEENAAYVTRGHLDILASLTKAKPKEIIFVGGASKGVLWPQILADVTNCTIKIPTVKETTSLGAIIAVMIGINEVKDWSSATRNIVTWDRIIEPNCESVKIYEAQFERWKQVYDKMLLLSDEGLLPGLWRAPGI